MKAPSVGTCFVLAVVLASAAALIIPQAGAQNALATILQVGEAEAQDTGPRLRQPDGLADRQAGGDSAGQTGRYGTVGTPNGGGSHVNNRMDAADDGAARSPVGSSLARSIQPRSNQADSTSRDDAESASSNPPSQTASNSDAQRNGSGASHAALEAAPSNDPPDESAQPDERADALPVTDWSGAPSRHLRSRSDVEQAKQSGTTGFSLIDTILPTASGLAIVIGLFMLVAWAFRKKLPRLVGALPTDVFEVLGKASLDKKHRLHLVRCGAKLALLSVSAAGVEALLEIDSPDEVTRLTGICHELKAGSSSANFRDVLAELNNSGRQKRSSKSTL